METPKNLGQAAPDARELTDLYSVPADKSVVLSSILVCNQTDLPVRFRVSHALGAAVDARFQYLYYDEVVPANKTFTATLGISGVAGDVLRVYSNSPDVSFNAYGVEIS